MSEMKAVRYHEYGDSGKLAVESVPRAAPQAGEISVKVHFAGVNPVDWKLRSGMYKTFMPVTFPATPGREFSGVVEEIGAGVTNFTKGQKVFGTRQWGVRGVRGSACGQRGAHSQRRDL